MKTTLAFLAVAVGVTSSVVGVKTSRAATPTAAQDSTAKRQTAVN